MTDSGMTGSGTTGTDTTGSGADGSGATSAGGDADAAQVFTDLRPLLFTIAYEITGSAADAEDVLQDSYIRWSQVDRAGVDNTRAYLASVVTRQSLNAVRSASRRREEYVGPWLPEPLATEVLDTADDIVLAESVSMAMLVVLESLSPPDRAIFVLREVFGFTHAEIATAVGKSVAAVRQSASRARTRVRAQQTREPADPEIARDIGAQFLAAANDGDVQSLMDMLAPDAVMLSDGGGKVWAARRPLRGRTEIARFVAGIGRRQPTDMGVELATYNAGPAWVITSGGRVDTVFMFDHIDAVITRIYAVRNPDKLATVRRSHRIAR